MMSMTHLTIGISAALIISNPHSVGEFLPPLIGGALGGIISDVDARSNPHCKDALYGRLVAIGIALIALVVDWFTKSGIIQSIISPERRIMAIIGAIVFAALVVIGAFQEHRGFTHSLLYAVLTSAVMLLIHVPIGISFAIGMLTHLLLDCLNKKPIRLFFPAAKGVCFNLCYADKAANKVFLILGILLIAFSFARPFIWTK